MLEAKTVQTNSVIIRWCNTVVININVFHFLLVE